MLPITSLDLGVLGWAVDEGSCPSAYCSSQANFFERQIHLIVLSFATTQAVELLFGPLVCQELNATSYREVKEHAG